jgi:hypothetical protein
MRTGAAVSEEGLLAHEASCGRYGRVSCPDGGRRSRDGLGGVVPVRLARTQPDGDRRAGSLGDGGARPDGKRRAQPTGMYTDAESNPRARSDGDSRAQPAVDHCAQPVGDGYAQPDSPHSGAQSVQVGHHSALAPVC